MAAQQHSWGEERLDMTPMGMVSWSLAMWVRCPCSGMKLLGAQQEAASRSAVKRHALSAIHALLPKRSLSSVLLFKGCSPACAALPKDAASSGCWA